MSVVVGCAASGTPTSADSFPTEAATETFSAGYSSIAAKYIEPVRVGDLAVEGLRGLTSIDPAIGIRQAEGRLFLTAAEQDVGQFAVPVDDNAVSWAALTVAVSQAGRGVSPELRGATVEQIYEAVFDSALSTLDPYSRYAGRDEARRNRSNRDGFGGIGIRFQIEEGRVVVTAVRDETPAAAVGLKVGDRITHVDGEPLVDPKAQKVSELLRGALDSPVRVTVAREGHAGPLDFSMTRAHIVPVSVTDSYEDGVVVLAIHRYNQATAETLTAKMEQARKTHGNAIAGVILDLRDNPGGLLRQGIRVADLFLSQGEILRTRGRHPDSMQYYEAEAGDMAAGLPLVVLVDGRSASAAEITAAALQDRGRAVVIGTTSFGKGTVQTVIRLPNDGEFTLTWSRFAAPSGYLLHHLGVHPLVCTSGTSADSDDPLLRLTVMANDEAGILAAWRTVGFADEVRRRELRDSCPAQSRPDPLDLEVARRLIRDPSLYARLLDLSNIKAASAAIH